MLYTHVAECIIFYTASVWYNGKVVAARRLLIIQRDLLLCVTECYNTVSNQALQVLSLVLPLDLRAAMERELHSPIQVR